MWVSLVSWKTERRFGFDHLPQAHFTCEYKSLVSTLRHRLTFKNHPARTRTWGAHDVTRRQAPWLHTRFLAGARALINTRYQGWKLTGSPLFFWGILQVSAHQTRCRCQNGAWSIIYCKPFYIPDLDLFDIQCCSFRMSLQEILLTW